MPSYLYQVSYTSEAWSALAKNPQNRLEAIRPVIEGMGGRLVTGYFAFGEYDVILIVDYPNNVAAAAFSVAASGGGAIKAIKTTPLISIEDGTEIMRMAAESGYSPPFEEIME